ncbi:MAG TPA: glutamate--tRNA ligase [Acidobacteriota bacterium]|nr:glutamate--tRNA ligase [Acidobacteriota bacterium]
MSVRLRFAPSPTGHLHVGNVRTALYNWLYARQHKGDFILRIEDTDAERSESRFEEALMDDLRWLGLDWDEGAGEGGAAGPYRQSERFDVYRETAQRLLEEGSAYYCFCTPQELEEDRRRQVKGEPPRYIGRDRDLDRDEALSRMEAGEQATVRFKVRGGRVSFVDQVFGPVEVDCATIADFVLLRSDRSPQYNFAVVVDDAGMGITHVVRGEGHLSNTPKQVLLYETLDLDPPQFAHLSTILGKDGGKLSKRHGATSIDQFRRRGYLPEAMVNYLALLGWTPPNEGQEILSVEELIKHFDLGKVHKSPATFDTEKLNWVNRSHLKLRPADEVGLLMAPFLREHGWLGEVEEGSPEQEWLGELWQAVAKYVDRLDQVPEHSRVVFDFHPKRDLLREEVREALSEDGAWRVIETLDRELQAKDDLDLESYKAAVNAVKDSTGAKGKHLFHPLRVALTLRTSGLSLDQLVSLLEKGKHLQLGHPVVGARERVRAVLEARS